MINADVLKPINLFAYLYFMGFGLIALAIPLTAKSSQSDVDYFYIFCYIFSFIHFLIGYGILVRKKWGFYLFKYYLSYFLRLGYPIGSVIAKNMLDYIDKNNVEDLFVRKTISIK